MTQCTENITASCSMRRPLLPVLRAYHVGPDLGLAGGTLSSPGGRLRRPRGIPGLPGQPGAPAVIGKLIRPIAAPRAAVQYESDQNAPPAVFTIPGCRCRSCKADHSRRGTRGRRLAAGRAYLAGAPPGRQAAAHRGRDRQGRRRAPHPAAEPPVGHSGNRSATRVP